MLMPNYEELAALRKETDPHEWTTKNKAVSTKLGGHASLFKGRGLDFSEFREYAPGDDIRAIDWRVTARKGRPHTKIFTEERERSVYVIVDLNSYMQFGTRNTFKSVQAARAAALLAWTSHHLRDKTGAILFGGETEKRVQFLPARSSRKSIWQMLRILCGEDSAEPQTAHDEVKIEEALELARTRVPTGSCIFLISDFFKIEAGFEKSLGTLAHRCDVTLVKVNDPADQRMPSSGRIRFIDDLDSQFEIDTAEARGVEHYQQLWAESEEALKEIAHKFRLKILRVRTDGDVRVELFRPRELDPSSAEGINV